MASTQKNFGMYDRPHQDSSDVLKGIVTSNQEHLVVKLLTMLFDLMLLGMPSKPDILK